MKKTLVLGASPDPSRYSYHAVQRLVDKGITVIPIGIRVGDINGLKIIIGKPQLADIHTVTIYLNTINQVEYYDYVIDLKPKRIIFNPGSENAEFINLAKKAGIEVQFACTLVMLSTEGGY